MDISWIKEGLKKPGKTQKGLADALGRDPAAVSRILDNKRQIRADEVQVIATYLETPSPSRSIGEPPAPVALDELVDLVRLSFFEVNHVCDTEGLALTPDDWADALGEQFRILHTFKYDDDLDEIALKSAGQAVANNVIRANFRK